MAFDVYAQADVVTAQLSLVPKAVAGSLETIFLQAILAGADKPYDLADILGLAPRLVLQVVGDLWRAGRVSVELVSDHERLSVTTAGREALAGLGAEGAVPTTATTMATEEVLVERLTGRALSRGSALRRVPDIDRGLVVPALPDDRDVTSVTSAELVAALSSSLGGEASGTDDFVGDQRVLSATVRSSSRSGGARRRFVKIRVAAQVSATDEVSITVLEERLSLSQRADATRRLQGVIDAQPQSKFVSQLRERASHVQLEDHGIDHAVDELRRVVESMDDCPAEHRQQRHDQALSLASQVASYAQALSAQEMDVQLVSTSEDHATVVGDLFREAQRQVVIVVPWIRDAGLEAVRAPLLAALEHGVQVVLVWGIGGHTTQGTTEGLKPAEAAWLDAISAHVHRHELPGKLVYSRTRAARSHAKFMVADDRKILITSKNFLSSSSHREVGVLLSAIRHEHGEHPSPVIEAALQYTFDKAPDPRVAHSLHRLPGAFGPRVDVPELPLHLPRLSRLVLEETAPESVARAWVAAWQDAADRACDLLERPRPIVGVVADLRHRGVLRDAVAAARSRLLVTSDNLTDTAVTQDMAEAFVTRARSRVPVVLRYQRVDHAGQGLADLLSRREDTPDLDLAQVSNMHAKVVLHDDIAVVTSLNPLSVDAALRRRRSTGEFGVTIASPEVADELWSDLTGRRAPDRTRNDRPSRPDGPSLAYIAQGLIEDLDSAGPEPLLALVEKHGAAAVLAAHAEYGTDGNSAIRVAGAVLAATHGPGPDRDLAVSRLVTELLGTGNWGLLDLLRHTLSDPGLRPRSPFTRALAEGGTSGESLVTALTGDDSVDDGERDALTIVDCVTLLLDGATQESGDSETLFAAATPGPSAKPFVDAATGYLRRYGALPALPPVRVSASTGEQLDSLWLASEGAFQGLAHYDSKSPPGKAVTRHIFRTGGDLDQLRVSLEGHDPGGIRTGSARLEDQADDEKWLDGAAREAKVEKIVEGRRRSFVDLRRKLRLSVTALARQLSALEADSEAAWPAEQVRALDEVLEQSRDLVTGAAEAPEAPVVITELEQLLAWASGRPGRRPVRTWLDWPFVHTYTPGAESTHAPDLATVGRDLATAWTGHNAVRVLLDHGELGRAEWVIDQLAAAGYDPDLGLSHLVDESRAQANEAVAKQVKALALTCQRAGVELDLSAHQIQVTARRADADARLAELTADLEDRIASRHEEVLAKLEEKRSSIEESWAGYVGQLVAAGDLVAAEHALKVGGGIQTLPQSRSFARWAWRDRPIAEIAAWFTEPARAPAGVVRRFTPHPGDRAGAAVIEALGALGREEQDAPEQWVSAVQQLINPDDDVRAPRMEVTDAYTCATLQLPYDQRLPPLRWWVDGDPMVVSIGEVAAPSALLRLSLDCSSSASPDAMVDVADVLSLLARTDTEGTPSQTDRALRFLAVVCSRLPLDQIIDPAQMPVGNKESARHRLGWFLATLGVEAGPMDLDGLGAWADGHRGVLWTLVQEARKDPIAGVRKVLAEDDLDALLISGIEQDLPHDEDLLVLAVGLLGALLTEGCAEADLAAAFEDEWHGSRPRSLHRVRVLDVVGRLKAAGYITERDGLLRACGCAAVRAVERVATTDWLEQRMNLVDAERLMLQRAYVFILEMVRHQHQAEAAVRSVEEQESMAQQALLGRLEDAAPFDLVETCESVTRDYRAAGIDLLVQLPEGRLDVTGAGPRIWVESLVLELLNNAYAAARDLPPGESTVRLTLAADPRDPHWAVLSVRNNGRALSPEARQAFAEGRRVHDPRRPGRGTGLHTFSTFGRTKGVSISLGEESGLTVVECRIPVEPAVG